MYGLDDRSAVRWEYSGEKNYQLAKKKKQRKNATPRNGTTSSFFRHQRAIFHRTSPAADGGAEIYLKILRLRAGFHGRQRVHRRFGHFDLHHLSKAQGGGMHTQTWVTGGSQKN